MREQTMGLLGALYYPDATYAIARGEQPALPEPDLSPFTDEDPDAGIPAQEKPPPLPPEAVERMGLVPEFARTAEPVAPPPRPIYRLAKG